MSAKQIAFILLAFFLVVFGFLSITNIHFQFDTVIEGFLALVAGIFMFLAYARNEL